MNESEKPEIMEDLKTPIYQNNNIFQLIELLASKKLIITYEKDTKMGVLIDTVSIELREKE